jgi:hypothetical protein
MELSTATRTTTITETHGQVVRVYLPDSKHPRKVTLAIHRTTEVGKRYADVSYSATLSVACAVETAEVDSQDVTGCVACEHLFGLFSGALPDACPDLRLNAVRNAILRTVDSQGDPLIEFFPLQHAARIRDLLPGLYA